MQDYERAFNDFIDGPQYDKAESTLFSLMRVAFTAGWMAAGGEPPPPSRAAELMRRIVLASAPTGRKPAEDE